MHGWLGVRAAVSFSKPGLTLFRARAHERVESRRKSFMPSVFQSEWEGQVIFLHLVSFTAQCFHCENTSLEPSILKNHM